MPVPHWRQRLVMTMTPSSSLLLRIRGDHDGSKRLSCRLGEEILPVGRRADSDYSSFSRSQLTRTQRAAAGRSLRSDSNKKPTRQGANPALGKLWSRDHPPVIDVASLPRSSRLAHWQTDKRSRDDDAASFFCLHSLIELSC